MYRRSRHRVMLAALLAASATVVTLDFRQNRTGPIRRLQDGAVSLVAPIQEGIAGVMSTVGDLFGSIGELRRLDSENDRLRERIRQLEATQREFPEVERERRRLLALLEEKDWKAGKKLTARVVSVSPSNQEWTALLNKGTIDGVAEGMAVVAPEGLAGRIVYVGDRYSKLLMIIDPHHSVGARLTVTGETGVVTGRSEKDMPFEFIDTETPVAEGETVVSSGYDRGIYPPGIPIGRVTGVKVARDGLSKTAFVRPFVDFTRLDVLYVLLESGPARVTP